MADILLVTYTARYSHCAFGLRYLLANLGKFQSQAEIVEYDLRKSPIDATEELLRKEPKIICLSCHIWNITQIRATAKLIKQIAPKVAVVLGGPEVSYETDDEPAAACADVVVCGEGDGVIEELCERLLKTNKVEHILRPQTPDLSTIELPYDFYTDEDIANRVIYVETSRGCPFRCAYCMSALDTKVRLFPIEKLLAAFSRLLSRGARHFKFVDRSFNILPERAVEILSFFNENYVEGLVVHVELVPSSLPAELREVLKNFPKGGLHIEVGVQTFDEAVGKRVGRPFKSEVVEEALAFLCQETGADVHADLIVGLPGETLGSFAKGFDKLVKLGPGEVQVGILKRLRGAPLTKKTEEWQLLFSETTPYEILKTKELEFAEIQVLRRFGRFFELLHNRGKLPETIKLLMSRGSPYDVVSRVNQWLYKKFGRAHDISLENLALALKDFLVIEEQCDEEHVMIRLRKDFERVGRRRRPHWLKK